MKKIISILFTVLLLTTSCDKWLDVNDDPNNPSEVKLHQMLPGIYANLSFNLGYNYMNLGYITGVYTHQITTRESIDQYGINGNDVEGNWRRMYTSILTNIEILIAEAENTDNSVYAGIGKLLKAYTFSQTVDLWGDVPYTESNGARESVLNAAFDSDEAIYTSLFALIDEAVNDINSTEATNEYLPGSDDLIYGGNKAKWETFANTLKLKLYVQVRKTSLYNQTEVDDILSTSDNYITSNADNFSVPYETRTTPDDRNPGMVSEYAGSQISAYCSPWFYEIMVGWPGTVFEGIDDPRVNYYFAEQLDAENSDSENSVEYRNGNFVSIYFGSVGPNRDAGGRATFTMLGLYPVGGAYNDIPDEIDRSEPLGTDVAPGNIPHRLITAADVQYLIAELIHDGKASGNQRDVFANALALSLQEVDIAAALGGAPLMSAGDVAAYTSAMMSRYDSVGGTATTADEKFEVIMTQKWIQKFGSSVDAYTDYRRTGYPVMFDPLTMVADGGPDGNGVVPLQLSNNYARRFPYSAEELSLNSSAPSQITPSVDKVFWDN